MLSGNSEAILVGVAAVVGSHTLLDSTAALVSSLTCKSTEAGRMGFSGFDFLRFTSKSLFMHTTVQQYSHGKAYPPSPDASWGYSWSKGLRWAPC